MSATDEFRRMLSIREVEWMPSAWSAKDETFYKVGDVGYLATELSNGKMKVCIEGYPTPEQAIAATLGAEDAYTREDVEGAFVSGYSLGCLPVGSDPTWDQNRQTVDEHMAELGWIRISDAEDASTDTEGHDSGHVRNVSSTLGGGTCKADETDTIKCWVKCEDEPSTERMELIHVMECSACGGTYEHVNGGYEFCPRCGARVVDE